MIRDPLLFDEERHAEALEQLTVQALGGAEFEIAFQYADRRCRIPPIAKPHHYVLRAEALYHSGAREAAIADVARALALAPDDLIANRRMLAWGKGAPRLEAARRLIGEERDMAVLASAINVLKEKGERDIAAVDHTDSQICGWAVWSGKAPLQVSIDDGNIATKKIPPDPGHPLRDCLGNAAKFVFDRHGSEKPVVITVQVGRRTIFETKIRGVAAHQLTADRSAGPSSFKARSTSTSEATTTAPTFAGTNPPLIVIVPVYADCEATVECLDSLLAELKTMPLSCAIVVDDACPDKRISAHLKTLDQHSLVRLIINPYNLGFVGSTNRALTTVRDSDVVLLNADTILPPGSLRRLREAARSAPAIGTVTPLSNDSEFTSFPVPNTASPVLTAQKISRLDKAAAAANAGVLVDIPNGTGFCLYITRECLSAVGALSEAYHRGYLEDADLCLRAREHGFRNVCAPSVYIGHVGSRSFRAEKRSLVVQNLAVIETRFPYYRAECGAFVSVDPLRVGRAAIELSLTPEPDSILLVTGSGSLAATTRTRARQMVEEKQSALILEIRPLAAGPVAHIFDSKGGIPQSLAFRIEDAAQLKSLGQYLERAKLGRIEIVDPAHIPGALLELLRRLHLPLDLFVADAGLVCPRGTLTRPDRTPCIATATTTCEGCTPLYEAPPRPQIGSKSSWRVRWAEIAGRADRILVPSHHARNFAELVIASRPMIDLVNTQAPLTTRNEKIKGKRDRLPHRTRLAHASQLPLPFTDRSKAEIKRGASIQLRATLGIATVSNSGADYELMRDLIRVMSRNSPEQTIIVLGRTIYDLGLMQLGNVFVTGAIEADEIENIFQQYAIGALFIAVRQPMFGHPIIERIMTGGLPVAHFDWSFEKGPGRPGHLTLAPSATANDIALSLKQWIAAQ